ncbi:alpha/beta hydrolase [Pseudonocardia sp. HH130630-07]|uniref:alpha/beta hydrolase n=1 Tax=Pseudonocardia sp. HH130630-07 TaxID=1690815 RepID=UPI00081535A1|nr:alpha/beta hydrolase [Pseudonocardia sp. HH130630-07]ANY05321.1 hydrolase [Pseudonocardia sp. HH130630-07]
MTRRRNVVRATAITVAVGLAGATVALLLTTDAFTPQETPVTELSWGACPADVVTPTVALQCATVPVPVDYSDPAGEHIGIMVSRLASADREKRRGVLLLNPGGPGVAGLTFPNGLVEEGAPAELLAGYDLIGFDPRGVGHSAPVSCGITTDVDYLGNIPPFAADDDAVREQATIAESVARGCADNDAAGHLRHVTTANTARDMDRIRVALGEEKISYLGFSYGTALGAAYASLFADRADRVVLDSNMGGTHLDHDGLRRYALGAEETFPDLARWLADRHEVYGLGSTPEQVRDTYFALAERVDREPVSGIDGRLFRLLTYNALFGPDKYPTAGTVWQTVAASVAVPGAAAPAPPPPPPGPSPSDNAFSAFLAVTCNDAAWSGEVDDYRRAVAEDRTTFPVFGAAGANIVPCAFWPHPPVEPPVEIRSDGPANVLISQNRHDPVTPLRSAELLHEAFGLRSRLVVAANGSGHGVYVGDDACARDRTTRFLVDGELPPADVVCD